MRILTQPKKRLTTKNNLIKYEHSTQLFCLTTKNNLIMYEHSTQLFCLTLKPAEIQLSVRHEITKF